MKFLEEEHERQKELINEKFLEELNATIYKEIIGRNMVELVEMDSGVKNMLEGQKYDELKNLYELFKYYKPSLEEISKIFILYIIKRGEELRKNKEISKIPQKFVPQLIYLHNEINNIVKDFFKNNIILQAAKITGFTQFMEKDYYSKQLAIYLDFYMRIGMKGKSEEEINLEFDNIIELFKHLDHKYIFKEECNRLLTYRLLKDASYSITSEKNFVKKLKQESMELVENMAPMLNDLERSIKKQQQYKESYSRGIIDGIEFNVKMFSYSCWNIDPIYLLDIKLPKIFSSCVKDFKYFFSRNNNPIKFTWWFYFSKLKIQYLYLNKNYQSISTLPQVLILIELEKNKILSIKALAENLNVNTIIIKEAIDGLIYNKTFNPNHDSSKGVIISITPPSSGDFNDKDEFKINENFVYERLQFNTIPIPRKKTEEQIKKEEEFSAEQFKKYRDSIIQSNIGRIMKSRNGLVTTHNGLINETAKQIEDKFKVQQNIIKDNIDKLIKDEVIKKDEKNKGCYIYSN